MTGRIEDFGVADYLLIDFENVQPKMLSRLQPGTARILVFLGEHQNRLGLELARALQPFGSDAEYVQITGSGPDAVDFHIAFYIGRISSSEPAAAFTIVSKDKGFDPLVKHVASLGFACRRVSEIPPLAAPPAPPPVAERTAADAKGSAPAKAVKAAAPRTSAATTTKARVRVVVERLKKSTKPASLATLRSSIKSYFQPALDGKSLDAVVQSLKDSKKVVVTGNKVTYALG